MEQFNSILLLIDSYVGGSQWFVALLLFTGLFFTIYLKFPQIRFFRHSLDVVSGKLDNHDSKGDTTHFQSLATALSGTIGTGNIAGVALAIHLGGPAALFWMLMTALLGMTVKLVEVSLSHKYREVSSDGTISGGPMYYIRDGLKLKWLAAIFAFATILSSFGVGSLPQMNSISTSMMSVFSIPTWLTGLVLSILLGFILIGGVKRIVKVTETLIPFMAIFFIIAALCVLVTNYQNIIPSIISIFSNLIDGTAATGGFLGAGVALAFNRGVNRGLFSNEAGQGSAAIAHAAARTKEPVSEGIVALLEPFIDTVVICMLTGVVLLSSGVWNDKFENKFQNTDMYILAGGYSEDNHADREKVLAMIQGIDSDINRYSGDLVVEDGKIIDDVSIIHSRSFAEDVIVYGNNTPYSGTLKVVNGKINDIQLVKESITVRGKSLVHSAVLSTHAFSRSFLGKYGAFIIPFALLLFAFSTAVAWYYYASRAVVFLWGHKYTKAFQVIYIVTFFIASFVDTTIVWSFSGLTVALMTLPNLIGMLLMRKEIKSMVNDYTCNHLNR